MYKTTRNCIFCCLETNFVIKETKHLWQKKINEAQFTSEIGWRGREGLFLRLSRCDRHIFIKGVTVQNSHWNTNGKKTKEVIFWQAWNNGRISRLKLSNQRQRKDALSWKVSDVDLKRPRNFSLVAIFRKSNTKLLMGTSGSGIMSKFKEKGAPRVFGIDESSIPKYVLLPDLMHAPSKMANGSQMFRQNFANFPLVSSQPSYQKQS